MAAAICSRVLVLVFEAKVCLEGFLLVWLIDRVQCGSPPGFPFPPRGSPAHPLFGSPPQIWTSKTERIPSCTMQKSKIQNLKSRNPESRNPTPAPKPRIPHLEISNTEIQIPATQRSAILQPRQSKSRIKDISNASIPRFRILNIQKLVNKSTNPNAAILSYPNPRNPENDHTKSINTKISDMC